MEGKGESGRGEQREGSGSGGKILHTLTISGHPEQQQSTSPTLVNKTPKNGTEHTFSLAARTNNATLGQQHHCYHVISYTN